MKRRTLITAGPAAGLLAITPFASRAQADGWRTFEVITRVEVSAPTGQVMVWVPLPLSQDTDWFQTLENSVTGNFSVNNDVIDPNYRAGICSLAFKPGEAQPLIELTSRFRTRDRKVELKPGAGILASAAEQAVYLKATEFMPTDGIVRETALKATRGARTDVEKARALYDWTVENTERNAKTRGCGVGDIKAMLESNNLSGKCADLNALFVALARSVGVPARDVYGVRVADSKRGYKSLGKSGDITRAQHCRAEFYAQNIGWVPVDPADVRKVVLEERPGLSLNDDVVKQARSMLWGGWEGNWLAFNYAHDVRLPGSSKAPVPFLMYPQAENAQGRLDSLDPDNFKYRMSAREIA
ncbi:MAG: transglutaminase domain-containing protein [Burkholderiaceae bacterium]|nr:transglutaminase domain-containing protein [Burkholderiaceae bacterium]